MNGFYIVENLKKIFKISMSKWFLWMKINLEWFLENIKFLLQQDYFLLLPFSFD